MPPRKVKDIMSPINNDRFNEWLRHYTPKDNIEVHPDGWVLPNRIKFSEWIHKNFKYKTEQQQLFPSQRFVKDFIQYDSPYRGVILFHGLGVGKSCASIVASENLISKMKVVILLPAALRTNYIEEIKNRCGNTYFSKQQNWKFIQIEKITANIVDVARESFVDVSLIKRQKGIWIPTKIGVINWDKLNDSDKTVINKQLDNMIENKYEFINYDGLSHKKISVMKKDGNPFDNKLVIIDEVHRVISGTVGSALVKKKLYELLLTAVNCKLILLSGTPIINYPFEVGYIINLLRGPQTVYELQFKTDKYDSVKIKEILEKSMYIDNYEEDHVKKMFTVQLTPNNFYFSNKKEFLVKRTSNEMQPSIIIDNLCKDLSCSVKKSKGINLLFPLDKETFNERFINFEKEIIINPRLLSRRFSGCISYFATNSGGVYPTVLPTKTLLLEMSDYQFDVYEKNRYEERDKEQKAKKKARGKKQEDNLFGSSGQIYRAYSRANCNFVFPADIQRPYPNKFRYIRKELDVVEDDIVDDIDIKKHKKGDDDEEQSYEDSLRKALHTLYDRKYDFLDINKVAEYSPKFSAFATKINMCQGKALVYSQFRKVEGLGIISMVLEANGWIQFKIKEENNEWVLDIKDEDMNKPKFFMYSNEESEKEKTKMLMKIFNNDLIDIPRNIKSKIGNNNLRGDIIKLIMITQSGAEGISLKHVREVHVMDPYWNEIRIEQVIGRAVRAGSHLDLPKSEHNVRVYRYMMKMTDKQIKSSKTIQNKDLNMTTDQYIYDIAQRKAKIIGEIQNLMKNSAVDCLVHSKFHDPSVKCLMFPKNSDPNSLTYNLNYDKEEPDSEYKQKVVKKIVKSTSKYHKCSLNGTYYAYDPNSKTLYDYDFYKEGKLVQVAQLSEDNVNGVLRMTS